MILYKYFWLIIINYQKLSEMLSFENISSKELVNIAKILDVSISPTITRDKSLTILELYGKYDDFCTILKFLNDTKRSSLKQFIFKVQKIVQKYILCLSYYNSFDWNSLNDNLKLLKQSSKYINHISIRKQKI